MIQSGSVLGSGRARWTASRRGRFPVQGEDRPARGEVTAGEPAGQGRRRPTQGEGDLGHALRRRLETDRGGQPLRPAARNEGSRVLPARERLEPLPHLPELGGHRRPRQPGQLAHGRQPEQPEPVLHRRLRRQQTDGHRGERRSPLAGGQDQARGPDLDAVAAIPWSCQSDSE